MALRKFSDSFPFLDKMERKKTHAALEESKYIGVWRVQSRDDRGHERGGRFGGKYHLTVRARDKTTLPTKKTRKGSSLWPTHPTTDGLKRFAHTSPQIVS